MFLLACKNLFHEKAKFLISVGGVAAALVLILILRGVFAGSEKQVSSYIDNAGADLFVMQSGVSNMHMAISILPPTVVEEVAQVAGVKQAAGIFSAYTSFPTKGGKVLTSIIGYSPEEGLGGPWKMAKGRKDIEKDEVVIDWVVARKKGIALGDTVEIMGIPLRVAGFSQEAFGLGSTVTFLHRDKVAEMVPGVSYVLVKAAEPGQTAEIAARIRESVPGVNVLTQGELSRNDRHLAKQMGTDAIRVMSSIGYVIGVMVVGLTIYTATIERSREYGVLKAVGADSRQLYRIVLSQAGISAGLGLALGVVLSFILASLLEKVLPEMLIALEVGMIGQAVAAAAVIALLSSYLPLRSLQQIDPLLVFRS